MRHFPSYHAVNGMVLRLGSLLFIYILAVSCQNVSSDKDFKPDAAHCQSCHLSPPPTGMHEFHLLDQKAALKISCRDCHSTAIDSIHWIRNIYRNFPRNLGGLQKIRLTDDSLYLERVLFIEYTYKTCEARVSGDSLYLGNLDSIVFSGKKIGPSDSIIWNRSGFFIFPLDTVFVPADSSYNIERGEPDFYSFCEYKIRGKDIYERVIGPLNDFITVIPKTDYVIDNINKVILARIPNFNQKYIQEFFLVNTDTAPFNLYPDSILKKFVTKTPKGNSYFLRDVSGNYMQIDNDSLYSLTLDSSMDYSNPLFAGTSELHADGKTDIQFEKSKFTNYHEQLYQAEIDIITGDTLRLIYKTVGSWNPVKKTCWSSGIYNNGACHTESNYETPWYPEKMTFTPP